MEWLRWQSGKRRDHCGGGPEVRPHVHFICCNHSWRVTLFNDIIILPPPYKYRGYIGFTSSVCPSVDLSVCPIVSAQYLLKNLFTILNVKVTVRAYIIKIWLYLLYLLNCQSVCSLTWLDSTASEARVSCGRIALICSISRSQQRFKMLVNVCPDGIFWTTEHFFHQTWHGYAAS